MSTTPSMPSVPLELPAPRRPVGVLSAVRREWLGGLVSLLGLYEIVLALSARPWIAGLGVVSGILVVAAPRAGRRMPPAAGLGLLVAGTVPFAVVTWWSIIIPVVALLALAIGVPVIGRRSRRAAPERRQE
ncbi:MAG: hypothetical protein ABSF03_27325 [Streptosporangiaceae bacterium]|jgi:hypothetical protein